MLGLFFAFFVSLTLGEVQIHCKVSDGDYPVECTQAAAGPKCVEGTCGCSIHADCFSNADYPYCSNGVCASCTTAESQPKTSNKDHYFCRSRFPGYEENPETHDPIRAEQVAPAGYYREFCVRDNSTSGGACHSCQQVPLNPIYKFSSIDSNEGASGTFFCNSIRKFQPICMDETYMKDAGVAATFDVNLRGSCVPCSVNAHCARALAATPICRKLNTSAAACVACMDNANCDSGAGGANCNSDGSCKSCTKDSDCSADGGAHKNAHCNVKKGICFTKCEDNTGCKGEEGNNCQKSGLCESCKADSDCGSSDGGKVTDQPLCNATTGLCMSLCKTNNDCVDRDGANCQADGRCHSCTGPSDCGANDGGKNKKQTLCDITTGICTTPFQCKTNKDCEGRKEGANCQADGSCISCTSEKQCGKLDGGDIRGQSNCIIKEGICTEKCKLNADCDGTQGTNCQADGVCKSCANNYDCGKNDGGRVPRQPQCDTTFGTCGLCTSNDGCTKEEANCGIHGFCFNCSTSEQTCGENDGPPNGPGKEQPHCEPETGLCVTYCTEDEHCEDECLSHCNLDRGCCVECNTNKDCPLPHWKHEAKDDFTTCSLDSYTCIKGCSIDDDCSEPSKPACSSRGECVACVADSHCASAGAKACATAQEKCVECVTGSHCQDETKPYCSPQTLACTEEPAGSVLEIVALVLAIIALVFISSWFVYFIILRRKSKDDTKQLLRTSTY